MKSQNANAMRSPSTRLALAMKKSINNHTKKNLNFWSVNTQNVNSHTIVNSPNILASMHQSQNINMNSQSITMNSQSNIANSQNNTFARNSQRHTYALSSQSNTYALGSLVTQSHTIQNQTISRQALIKRVIFLTSLLKVANNWFAKNLNQNITHNHATNKSISPNTNNPTTIINIIHALKTITVIIRLIDIMEHHICNQMSFQIYSPLNQVTRKKRNVSMVDTVT